jgi:hypothetical protein
MVSEGQADLPQKFLGSEPGGPGRLRLGFCRVEKFVARRHYFAPFWISATVAIKIVARTRVSLRGVFLLQQSE